MSDRYTGETPAQSIEKSLANHPVTFQLATNHARFFVLWHCQGASITLAAPSKFLFLSLTPFAHA